MWYFFYKKMSSKLTNQGISEIRQRKKSFQNNFPEVKYRREKSYWNIVVKLTYCHDNIFWH